MKVKFVKNLNFTERLQNSCVKTLMPWLKFELSRLWDLFIHSSVSTTPCTKEGTTVLVAEASVQYNFCNFFFKLVDTYLRYFVQFLWVYRIYLTKNHFPFLPLRLHFSSSRSAQIPYVLPTTQILPLFLPRLHLFTLLNSNFSLFSLFSFFLSHFPFFLFFL